MQRILAATDLSEQGSWAVERAARLAAGMRASLLALHVADPAAPAAVAGSLHREARRMLEDQLAAHRGLTEPEVHVEAGQPVESIVTAAERLRADLVVIGRHREHSLLDLFRGSTGERIVRLGNAPVLAVSRAPANEYLRVLVAVDFSMPSRLALELAASLFPSSELHAVHAWEIPFGAMTSEAAERTAETYRRIVNRQMAEFIAGLPPSVPRVQRSTRQLPPAVAIRESARSIPADLLVLGTHGRTGVVRAFLGSVTEDMLKHPPCDVLAVQGW